MMNKWITGYGFNGLCAMNYDMIMMLANYRLRKRVQLHPAVDLWKTSSRFIAWDISEIN